MKTKNRKKVKRRTKKGGFLNTELIHSATNSEQTNNFNAGIMILNKRYNELFEKVEGLASTTQTITDSYYNILKQWKELMIKPEDMTGSLQRLASMLKDNTDLEIKHSEAAHKLKEDSLKKHVELIIAQNTRAITEKNDVNMTAVKNEINTFKIDVESEINALKTGMKSINALKTGKKIKTSQNREENLNERAGELMEEILMDNGKLNLGEKQISPASTNAWF